MKPATPKLKVKPSSTQQGDESAAPSRQMNNTVDSTPQAGQGSDRSPQQIFTDWASI